MFPKDARSAGSPPEPRRLEPGALPAVLEAHRRWAETAGAEGRRADLRGTDLAGADLGGSMLQGADLAGADLKEARLAGADLRDVDLSGANLQGADLAGADLRLARLDDAILRDADLRDADLAGARGVLSGALGGTDLASAKLPEGVAFNEGLTNVAEASKTTQGLFFSLLLVCAYSWLTIASTRDAQLLNNAAPPASRLPILGTDIPLVQFYLVAPLLLLCLYVYFHLCLQRLWEELGELPAVFPDGRTLDRKAYPWLLNVLVREHATRLRQRRSPLARWQAGISVLLAWGLVPFSILLLWGRYLRAHDWPVTGVHVALGAAALGGAVGFRRLAAATLRGAERRPFLWQRAWRDARTRFLAATAASIGALGLLSFGAIEGVNSSPRLGLWDDVPLLRRMVDLRYAVPRIFEFVGYSPYAQLDDASLSTRPANWSGGLKPGELDTVKGADLEGRNLRYAMAYSAFAVNSYLKHADASGSDLRSSDFRKADLREAVLIAANLRSAALDGCDLRWANLSGANLKDSSLSRAKLDEAILTGASLVRADLTGARLVGADLTGAQLDDANLAGADLTDVVGLTAEALRTARIDAATSLPEPLRQALADLETARRGGHRARRVYEIAWKACLWLVSGGMERLPPALLQ